MGNYVKKESFGNKKQILFMTQPYAAVGVIVGDTGVTAGSDGKKIIKAGTPLAGSLQARTTPFTVAADSGSAGSETNNAVGVLLHDVDVTAGPENATLVIFGFVDLNKIDSDVEAKITVAAQESLRGIVTFLK